MISELVIGELVDILCSPCSGHSPGLGGSLAGAGGSGAASQGAPTGPPDIPPCSDAAPSSPTAGDIGSDVALGLGSDAAVEIAAGAAGTSGAAGGVLSVLGAAVSGSQSLAEGLTTIFRNGGRGFGGSSCGGRSSMEAAMAEINGTGSAVR